MATLFPKHLKHEWMPLLEPTRKKRKAMAKKRSIKWHNEYNRINYKKFLMCIDVRTEQDMIAWLEANKPYNTAIKKLIRAQIAREADSSENN